SAKAGTASRSSAASGAPPDPPGGAGIASCRPPRQTGAPSGSGGQRMNRDQLRAVQAPLKQRYRDDPQAAVVTLKAQGGLGDGVACSVETGRALVEAGLHPASGGSGAQACSGDMLLQALVACAGVTLA